MLKLLLPGRSNSKEGNHVTVSEGYHFFTVLEGSMTVTNPAPLHEQPVDFGPPFDDNDADLILRSSNNVDFPVHRVCLCKASLIFKTLFSSQVPSGCIMIYWVPDFILRPSGTKGGVPVFTLTEPSPILHALLSLILPITPIYPANVKDALALVSAAHKYGMQIVALRARAILDSFLTIETCLRVFVVAHHLGLRDELIKAAQLSLGRSFEIEDYDPKHPDTFVLRDLQRYREAYAHAASKKLSSPGKFTLPSTPSQIDEWIAQQQCRARRPSSSTHPRCSNTANAWKSMILGEMKRMAPEVAMVPQRLCYWRYPILAGVGSAPCHTSSTCNRLWQKAAEVEDAVREMVVEFINESVMDKVSRCSHISCLCLARSLIYGHEYRSMSSIYSVILPLSLYHKRFPFL